MSILDENYSNQQPANTINNQQIEAIKGTLDAMKLCAFLPVFPGVYGAVTVLKLIFAGVFNLDMIMLFILAVSYAVAGISTYFASRALTSFTYAPNANDFEDSSNHLKIAWLAWATWAVVATFYCLYLLYNFFG